MRQDQPMRLINYSGQQHNSFHENETETHLINSISARFGSICTKSAEGGFGTSNNKSEHQMFIKQHHPTLSTTRKASKSPINTIIT